jgi:hypothetical protein
MPNRSQWWRDRLSAVTIDGGALRANGPLVTKLRRVGYNYLIQLKIRLGRVALVSA